MYLSSIAVWMWRRSAFSTFLHSRKIRVFSVCVSRVCMAFTAVAVDAITSRAGKFGASKAAGVGLMRTYSALVKNKPKYPWSSPPRLISTLISFSRNSVLSRFSDLLVGYLLVGVGVGYLKYDVA